MDTNQALNDFFEQVVKEKAAEEGATEKDASNLFDFFFTSQATKQAPAPAGTPAPVMAASKPAAAPPQPPAGPPQPPSAAHASQQTTAPQELKTHMDVGKLIAASVPGFGVTKDLYGGGPDQHGSAWKAAGGNFFQQIGSVLVPKGFTEKKVSGGVNYSKDEILVELGFNPEKNTTYAYITDNSGLGGSDEEIAAAMEAEAQDKQGGEGAAGAAAPSAPESQPEPAAAQPAA